MATADSNGDSKPDLAVKNIGSGTGRELPLSMRATGFAPSLLWITRGARDVVHLVHASLKRTTGYLE